MLHNPPNVTGITAFMPADPKNRHHFALDEQEQIVGKEFNLELLQIKPPSNPVSLCIDKAFSSFCAEHTTWSPGGRPKLLTIDLPVPNNILPMSGETPLSVTFKSMAPAKLWRTFVLEYDLDISDLELIETSSGLKIPMPSTEFYVEVGLAKTDGDDGNNSHARDFYNNSLLPYFPSLQTPDHIIATITAPFMHPETTTTFECKSGGIIGGSP